jgi:hypothetical protein
MKKIKENLEWILLVLLVFVLFRSCGTGSEVSRLKKQIDSINTKMVTEQKMRDIIKTTPNWKTLEIEELSDKEHIPINHYKNEEEKK